MKFMLTGGSRGIGRAIVRAALLEGHDMAFTYVNNAEAAGEVLAWAKENAPGRTCRAHRLDVRDPDAVEEVGDRILDEFDTIDCVVCNAGINRTSLAFSMSNEEWHDVIDTNLNGSFYVARHFLPAFLARGRGRLVFIGSLSQHGISGEANYSASKAGVVGLAKALGKEYGRKGITANVVVPGFFDSDMTRETMSPASREYWDKYCPIGRMGQLDDMPGVVLFLASDASRYINCETIMVTGGLDWTP
ncbi:MAG: SDR family oxidoreductase [Desulfobacterales bacterium]|nr:SDR family oxidoreductase [Desulfobacterales bacterium]